MNVDLRTELISIIQFLGKYDNHLSMPLIRRHTDYYQDQITEYFWEFENHPMINLSDVLSKNGFCFDAPIGFVLGLDIADELFFNNGITQNVIERIPENAKVTDIIESLNSFMLDTDFFSFFNSQKNYYQTLVTAVDNELEQLNIIETFKNLIPMANGEFQILINPLSFGYFGAQQKNNHNHVVYAVLGITTQELGGYLQRSKIAHICWHEFLHSVINPITDRIVYNSVCKLIKKGA